MEQEIKSKDPHELLDDVAEAVVVEKPGISYIWIIPLVAVLIAAWLAYKSVAEQGPVVTVSFSHAEGIEAGKTKVRFKDVDIGLVEHVSLSQDLSQVVVSIQLVKGAERYLSKDTRFWIVKARLNAGEVSGLDTLFSGVYIGIDPVINGEPASHFEGLDKPPIVSSDEAGRHFILRAQSLGSLDTGAAVYFRQIEVGQIVDYELSADNEYVDIQVFVRAPYYQLITTSTRFWDISGMDVKLDASGVHVNTESLATILLGGIAFETPVSLEKNTPAEEYTLFEFYESRHAAQVKRYSNKSYYVLYFNESVRGLTPGAPVEFRGMEIGRVVDVRIEFDADRLDVRIPVLIEVEPERFNIVTQPDQNKTFTLMDTHDVVDALVAKGLRAQLATGNLLLGQLVVELDFHDNVLPAQVVMAGEYPVLPTVTNQFEEITTGVVKVIDKLNALPLDDIGRDFKSIVSQVNTIVSDPELATLVGTANETLNSISDLSNNLNAQSVPALNTALAQAEDTLNSAQLLIGPDAPVGRELNRLIIELAEAARAVRLVADYLERHPEALLYGKGEPD